jgi:hypothetical protein
LLIAVLTAVLMVPSSAAGQVLSTVNQQRAENGLPTVRERADWSEGCRRHIAYMAAHFEVTHEESDVLHPTFSEEGKWAGENSVLAYEEAWTVASPWFDAPIHLHQFLTPLLRVTGLAEQDGFQCAIVDPGYTRALSRRRLWTYPGDGRSGVPASEVADEEPSTPGEYLGIERGTRTGPSLLVWAGVGPAEIISASLTGPDGKVRVRWIDNTTRDAGEYLTPGGIIVPVNPLRDNAGYRANVRVLVDGRILEKTWRFGTGTAPAPPKPPDTGLSRRECQSLRLRVQRLLAVRRTVQRDARRRKLLSRANDLRRQIRREC